MHGLGTHRVLLLLHPVLRDTSAELWAQQEQGLMLPRCPPKHGDIGVLEPTEQGERMSSWRIPETTHAVRETEAQKPSSQAEHPITQLPGGCSACWGLTATPAHHPRVRSGEVGAGVGRVYPGAPLPSSAADSRLHTSTAAGTAEREATKMI